MNSRTLFICFTVALIAGAALVEGALRSTEHTRSSPMARSPISCKSPELRIDVDGDGRLDRVRVEKVDNDAWADVYMQSGDRWTLRSTTRLGEWSDNPQTIETMDADGDGKMDLVLHFRKQGVAWARVFLSNGQAFEQGWQGPSGAGHCTYAC